MTAAERPWYACDSAPCTCPKIGEVGDERTADDILADLRDLIAVIDKQQPAYRYIRTRTLLDLIDGKAS